MFIFNAFLEKIYTCFPDKSVESVDLLDRVCELIVDQPGVRDNCSIARYIDTNLFSILSGSSGF